MESKMDKLFYLKGYREGFEAALKIAWAHAEEMRIKVNNDCRPIVDEYIEKLKA